MRGPRRAALAVMVGLALVGAACGGGDSNPDVAVGEVNGDEVTGDDAQALADLVAASPDRLEAESSARMTLVMEMTGIPELGTELSSAVITADGEFDFETGNAVMNMDMSSMGVPGLDAYEMRVVDQVVYMNLGSLGATFGGSGTGDASWMKVDPGAAAGELGIDPDDLAGGATDPTAGFDLLRGLSSSVTDLGRETVRDTETTRYLVELDAQAVLEQSAAQLPEGLAPSYSGSVTDVPFDTLPVEAWIDDDGIVRRMVISLSGADLAGSVPADEIPDEIGMIMTMEMYDFGVDVNVEAPPDADTVDMTEMLAGPGSLDGLDGLDSTNAFEGVGA